MEDRRILDSQITASSESTDHQASKARLNRALSAEGSWSAAVIDAYQWIQVDLGVSKMVSGIVLQGRDESDNPHWVTKYQVNYSVDAISWMWVKDVNQQDVAVRMIVLVLLFVCVYNSDIAVVSFQTHNTRQYHCQMVAPPFYNAYYGMNTNCHDLFNC